MKLDNSSEFLNALSLFVEKEMNPKRNEASPISPQQSIFKLGRIDPNYSTGRPRIIFEGESILSGKQYPYLSSYTPQANDIVLLARVSNSYIVLGRKL